MDPAIYTCMFKYCVSIVNMYYNIVSFGRNYTYASMAYIKLYTHNMVKFNWPPVRKIHVVLTQHKGTSEDTI